MKAIIILAIAHLIFIPISYSGCMGYWQAKYHGNPWDDRGFCVVIAIIPGWSELSFPMTGFFNRGFAI